MSLNALARPGTQPGLPHLVWLHGLLGNHQEWIPIAEQLAAWPQLLIDLPGHGASQPCRAENFNDVCQMISQTLHDHRISRYWLLGYSLGGRIAMYYATLTPRPGLCGLVVEGSHPGLASPAERAQRQRQDRAWAERFQHHPLDQVLADWYRQPVFSSLNEEQRQGLIAVRRQNNPQGVASLLLATSLAVQPDLRQAISQLHLPFYYLCGEQDTRFRAIAQSFTRQPELIAGTGHNAHRESPLAVSQRLRSLLTQDN